MDLEIRLNGPLWGRIEHYVFADCEFDPVSMARNIL